jgi:hypothetical protein
MDKPLRPKKGGFLRPFGCGQFIRSYLLGNGLYGLAVSDTERGASINDIRSAYKEALLQSRAEDAVAIAKYEGVELSTEQALKRIRHHLTVIRSHSFYRYFHLLKQLGWVEPTGQEEDSLAGGNPGSKIEHTAHGTTLVEVPQPRRYYKISEKGKAMSEEAWKDPLQTLYNYPSVYRSQKGSEKP